MNEKIEKIIEEIEAEAKKKAMSELISSLVENSEGIWAELKKRCGKDEAAMAVICLLGDAASDGAITAVKYDMSTQESSEDETEPTEAGFGLRIYREQNSMADNEPKLDKTELGIQLMDEKLLMIYGLGGVCITVRE